MAVVNGHEVDTKPTRVRNTTLRSLVQIIDGVEKPYPVYAFSGRRFVEKPRRAYT